MQSKIDIDRIKETSDIVRLVERRVRLKKSGQNYLGLCPFHEEKTPSFTVSAEKQFYHCFGCGAHGDVFTWLMQTEGLSFIDAVRQLAGEAGIVIPERSPGYQAVRESQAEIYAVNELARAYFSQLLASSPAARRYLDERGLSAESIRKFSLGWSGESIPGDASVLLRAGLLCQRPESSDTRPFFFQRVMFPIRDQRGRVAGFGGRTLRAIQPKYLNTAETSVFNKGHILYGLYESQTLIRKLNHVIVVEGYLDTVLMHQYGFENTVATCGTAMTEYGLKYLLSMANRLTFAFDGDKAGRSAARRVIEKIMPMMSDYHRIEFVFLPAGDDPDSFLRKHGREEMQKRLELARPLSDIIVRWFTPVETATLEEKAQMAQSAQTFLAALGAQKLKELLANTISTHLGVKIVLASNAAPTQNKRIVQTDKNRKAALPSPSGEAQKQEDALLVRRHVIYPVLRTLMAFPGCWDELTPRLRDVPLIKSAIEYLENVGINPDSQALRSPRTRIEKTLAMLYPSAMQRREITRPENAAADARHVFANAEKILLRLISSEDS